MSDETISSVNKNYIFEVHREVKLFSLQIYIIYDQFDLCVNVSLALFLGCYKTSYTEYS